MKEFKLIVAGGRDFGDRKLMDKEIRNTVAELPDDCVVSIVSGMAKRRLPDGTTVSADWLAYAWALENKCVVYKYHANWKAEPRRAGYLRNQQMCDVADGLLAFHDGISKGTKHMIAIARNKGIYVKVIPYVNESNKAINYE